MLDLNSEFYKKLFYSLDNNAVIMRVEEDGIYHPIWCTREFAEMMESTIDECLKMEKRFLETIHIEDREKVEYLFKNHKTIDGSNNLTIRRYTFKNNLIWVNLHYAFVEDNGILYAYCNYLDVTQIKENERKVESLYQSTLADLESLSGDALSFLKVNLTTDVLIDIRGSDTFSFDPTPGADHISEWNRYLPLESDRTRFAQKINPKSLIETFNSGVNKFTDYFFTQRKDGRKCFVKVTENMRQDPTTGDIISFFTEYDYNNEMIVDTILNKALVEQYDMITSLINEDYTVVFGDRSRFKGETIFPKHQRGNYSEYLKEEVFPVLTGTEEEVSAMKESLDHTKVVKELNKKDFYEADIICKLNGETTYKRFVFYVVNRETKFYILLKSDITAVIKEQRERNEILASALKGAEQANAAKTSFLSNMSHEIRTPMNAIIGIDNIALSDPNLPPKTREQLIKIDSSAKHLLSLINDILDMSRIESGRITINNEEFSFREMLDQINTMIGGQCQDKGLTYEFKVTNRVGEYYVGDDIKLKQVLINVLGNAVKFTPEGGKVSFFVDKTAEFANKSSFKFTISDTGIGMSPDFIPKLFDAFSQESDTSANKYGSTGLGMAITKNIVEMMNGTISVESEKGVGSTFTVRVTLMNSEKNEQVFADFRPQDARVLIIDDNPIDCEQTKLTLEKIGISSVAVLGGKDALKQIELNHARREPYNVILLDWRMPEQSGLEVTKEIRKLYGDDAAIIVLTAYNLDDIAAESLDAGVDGLISKPLQPNVALDEFRRVASLKSGNKENKQENKVSLEGRRILLAEDVEINAEIMKELLGMKNIEADHAENGQVVVDMFKQSDEYYYDAILMDVRMPIKNGLEATKDIRALNRPDAKEIPIIALTANAFDEDVQQSLQAGMNAHLSKPVEPDRLYKTLESLIKDR